MFQHALFMHPSAWFHVHKTPAHSYLFKRAHPERVTDFLCCVQSVCLSSGIVGQSARISGFGCSWSLTRWKASSSACASWHTLLQTVCVSVCVSICTHLFIRCKRISRTLVHMHNSPRARGVHVSHRRQRKPSTVHRLYFCRKRSLNKNLFSSIKKSGSYLLRRGRVGGGGVGGLRKQRVLNWWHHNKNY